MENPKEAPLQRAYHTFTLHNDTAYLIGGEKLSENGFMFQKEIWALNLKN